MAGREDADDDEDGEGGDAEEDDDEEADGEAVAGCAGAGASPLGRGVASGSGISPDGTKVGGVCRREGRGGAGGRSLLGGGTVIGSAAPACAGNLPLCDGAPGVLKLVNTELAAITLGAVAAGAVAAGAVAAGAVAAGVPDEGVAAFAGLRKSPVGAIVIGSGATSSNVPVVARVRDSRGGAGTTGRGDGLGTIGRGGGAVGGVRLRSGA